MPSPDALRSRKPSSSNEEVEKKHVPGIQLDDVPSVSEPQMLNAQRLLVMTVYTMLLFSTVLLGFGYAFAMTRAEDSLERARLPKEFAHTHTTLPSYFADKRNIFNQIFVKKAWAWTSLAFFLLLGVKATTPPPHRPTLSSYAKPLVRYGCATGYWLLFTAWFFGPSVTDRILMLTGAQCVPSSHLSASMNDQSSSAMSATVPVLEYDHCLSGSEARKTLKAQLAGSVLTGNAPDYSTSPAYWQGGHDISGHTFMLVHASLFLLQEIAPFFSALWQPQQSKDAIKDTWRRGAVMVVAGLMGLWWAMLLATSVYFHTPVEKLSGFVVGVAEAFVVQYVVGV